MQGPHIAHVDQDNFAHGRQQPTHVRIVKRRRPVLDVVGSRSSRRADDDPDSLRPVCDYPSFDALPELGDEAAAGLLASVPSVLVPGLDAGITCVEGL